MQRLFGAKKPEPVIQKKEEEKEEDEEKEPVEEKKPIDLTEQSNLMEQQVQKLNGQVTEIDKQMAELYAKMKSGKGATQQMYKQRCVMLLRKKKLYEQQLQQLLNQQFSLDQMAFTKENIQNTIQTSKAMKEAVGMQQTLMKELNLDEMEDIRDEMEEMMQESNQINEALNRNYACDVDEAEIDDELRELDDELFKDVLNSQQNKNLVQINQSIPNQIVQQNQFQM